jgi:predicted nuclease with TOPRIM domain
MAKKNMSVARVSKLSAANAGKSERHNERKNESYANINIVPERTPYNVSFKSTDGLTYNEYFKKLVSDGTISTRGLKADATLFNEMVIDVNTEFFETHGGYEYAKQFFEEAYRFCCKVYGEDKIVSAVMHADELNKAVTEKYGKPVYHYHLHVVAIPTVEKEIRWSKRCKDPELRGTVKEVIHQVSHSKKWKNTVPLLNDKGEPVLNESGKPVFVKSYSILQDDLFDHMRAAGFSDFERGEKGSTVEHLTSLEYQIRQDQERLKEIEMSAWAAEEKAADAEGRLSDAEGKLEETASLLSDTEKMLAKTQVAYKRSLVESKMDGEINAMGKKTITGKISISEKDFCELSALAKEGISSRGEIGRLNDKIGYYTRRVSSLSSTVNRLEEKLADMTQRYNQLVELTRPYLEALQRFPDKVREFFEKLFPPKQREREQEQPKIKQKHRSWDRDGR